MGNISKSRGGAKPCRRSVPLARKPVLSFVCYIDTLALFFPIRALRQAEQNRLRELYGATPHTYVNGKKGYMLLSVQCPQPDLIEFIAELVEKYGGNISRLDIAADARLDANMSVNEQHAFIKEHLLLRNRRAEPIHELRNADGSIGSFYVPHAHTKGAPRDICLYADQPSKLDPSIQRVAHFDLRLRRDAIAPHSRDRRKNRDRKGTISETSELLHLDPSEVMRRHVRFVQFDRTQFERRLFRKVMKDADTLEEAKGLIAHIKRYGQLEYVQRVHDQYPQLQTDNGLVSFPTELAWGAQRRSLRGLNDKTTFNDFKYIGEENIGLSPHKHDNYKGARPMNRDEDLWSINWSAFPQRRGPQPRPQVKLTKPRKRVRIPSQELTAPRPDELDARTLKTAIKAAILDNPRITVRELKRQYKCVSGVALAAIRSNFLADLKFLQQRGVIAEDLLFSRKSNSSRLSLGN